MDHLVDAVLYQSQLEFISVLGIEKARTVDVKKVVGNLRSTDKAIKSRPVREVEKAEKGSIMFCFQPTGPNCCLFRISNADDCAGTLHLNQSINQSRGSAQPSSRRSW